MTMTTRTAFCEKCYANNRPKLKEQFLVYGTHSKEFHIYTVEHYGTRGFTPHIILLKKVIGNNVEYQSSCGICDVDIWETPEGNEFEVLNHKTSTITIGNWNAWQKLKRDKSYFL